MSHRDAVWQATDALLLASRSLVGVAARSLADADEVTLPQWRALVLVSSRERTTVSDLADALHIHPTSATRLCDRLVRKRLIRRVPAADDRRLTDLRLAAAGRRLVERVTARRRQAIASITRAMSPDELDAAIRGLEAFARHADEAANDADLFGWEARPT